jgi:erythronate-4-phosphate dehydrogenase
MKTVVAKTVMLGGEAFETLGDVDVIPDRQIGPKHLTDADALIIRSKTKVTPELLAGSSVRFVGTATAGFEHMGWLASRSSEEQSVGWCASPGCNADSVADYITAALLLLHTCAGLELEGKTLGIIGVGQVGSRVAKRAEALGLQVLLNDPPRAAREGGETFQGLENNKGAGSACFQGLENNKGASSACFQGLETLLAASDIVTMHVPLITEKPWPTLRMANCRFFEKMKRGSTFINASRGQVLDADALLHAKENGVIAHAILDVWNPEPCFRTDVLAAADIATAHIAGHSLEGKLNGTIHVYREACQFFEQPPTWDPAPNLPALALPELHIDSQGKTDIEVLAEAALAAYNIAEDDALLREAAVTGEIERAKKFDFLRANYRVRREFFNTKVILSEERPELLQKVHTLGFST